MTVMTTIHCYHTCKLKGPINEIRQNVPYRSSPDIVQWLGQGYYFWTDSYYFARQWGRNQKERYPIGYVISKFELEIPSDAFLDLVGNVQDQLKFEHQILEYVEKLEKEVGTDAARNTPISKVLAHLRLEAQDDPQNFPYTAIKAADIPTGTNAYRYADGTSEKMIIPTRQQLFLDLSCTGYIQSKELYEAFRLERGQYKRQNISK